MPAKPLPVEVDRKFQAALDALIERVRKDRSILAAVLCGSLSHDKVWSKSDIDLLLITIDDRKAPKSGISLYADGINVHAILMPRAGFREMVQGATQQSFAHSWVAKGRLLYTHDEALGGLFERMHAIGERDTRSQLLASGANALGALYKVHKFYETRRDLEYTAFWILETANALARVEVIAARQLADREVLPQAMKLNPEFFKIVYSDLLNTKKTSKSVEAAIAALDEYVASRTDQLFGPLIEYLRELGEARSCTDLEGHFTRNFGIHGVTTACEYLADRGIFGKAALPAQLTKRSNVNVEELAFFYAGEPPDAW
jgi:hypothetical protein